MKVFKFGGASVKDADAVKNVVNILSLYPEQNLAVVVSAMGKSTNALEDLVNSLYNDKDSISYYFEKIKVFHLSIVNELFNDKNHAIFTVMNNLFVELEWSIEEEALPNYNQQYDQIVSMGEVFSSTILHHYLIEAGIKNVLIDARGIIATDNTYREGVIEWDLTEENIKNQLNFEKSNIFITQGFIGYTSENFITTLGREGSDYTAAIIGYVANAEEVVIWKDVPGVLNADPKYFENTIKLDKINYQDAIELTYYGATVIHPKTIKPLQNKNIPLKVKSFLKLDDEGTLISDVQYNSLIPSFIFKTDQILISISPKDFSFIVEQNLSKIFTVLAERQVKINLMQNSALSFSVCVDNTKEKINELIEELQQDFRILYNESLQLITIRYYDEATITKVLGNKELILEQKSRNTIQMVVRH